MRDETTEPLNKKSKNDDSIEHVSEASEVWLSYNGYRLTLVDKKKISDGSMLNDNHINFAQSILKNQFQVAEGFDCSLYQYKHRSIDCKIKCGLQIVHCRGNHWILASNMTNQEGILDVYDSVYSNLDEGTLKVLENLFIYREVRIVEWQKQIGGSDCGLFAIAAATQLLSQENAIFHFCQVLMRDHALKCYENKNFSCFPN